MKYLKYIYPALVLILMVELQACETKNATVEDTIIRLNGAPVQFYIIDSCEYLGYVAGPYGDYLTHKGNCKYCAARKCI